MSRKAPDSHRGFNDVIGIALLAVALLLLVAQLSFDSHDIKGLNLPLNKFTHNWIGPLGAYLAWIIFLPFGIVAYLIPPLLALFGAAYLFNFLSYLHERLRWSLLWSITLLISLTGLLYVFDPSSQQHNRLHEMLGTWSVGGGLGWLTYGETPGYKFGFSLLGRIGATIVYSALCLISLLFLTNFHLGVWIRALLQNDSAGDEPEKSKRKTLEELALERRAEELEKQAKKLQEEVARSGLGADGLPVPEPTVRDLSVPQARQGRYRKTTLPESHKPARTRAADEGEVIPAKEIAAATTEEILGKKTGQEKVPEKSEETKSSEPKSETAAGEKIDSEKPAEEKTEPEIKITGIRPRQAEAVQKGRSPSPSPRRR